MSPRQYNQSPPHWITARFPSKCATCNAAINVDQRCWWISRGRIQCASCRDQAEQALRQENPSYTPPPSRESTPPYYVRTFDSWKHFVDTADFQDPRGGKSHRDDDWRREWASLGLTFAESITLARTGWEDNASEINSLSQSILGSIRPTLADTFATYFDVSGSEVDVGRYLSGEPEHMVEYIPVKVSSHGRVIKIHVNITCSSGVSGQSIVQRGAAIVALIDILSQLQHSTEVVVEDVRTGARGKKYSYIIPIKSAHEHLDLGTLAFALSHPAMLRRLCFSVNEQESDSFRSTFSISGNYGMPASITNSDADIVLDKINLGQSPTDWIITHLAKFGLIEGNNE